MLAAPQTEPNMTELADLEDMNVDDEYTNNCYESVVFIRFQYTIDDFLLAACTASTVFNVMVIFCAVKLFKRSGDTMHLFIINMTLGDLLLTVFCHPNEFLTRKHEFLRHVHLCAVIHFCNWLGLAVSGLSLTLLNVDKLIYFRWPLSYDMTMSKKRAAVLCILIWCLSLGFVSYIWVFDIVYVTSDCMLQMSPQKKHFYEIFMIMFCVLPVTSSLIVSIYLFRLTRQKRSAPVPMNSNQVDIKNKLKSLVFIFATTAWTSFSLLPYRIFNICRIHLFEWNSIDCETREVMNWLAWMLLYLLTTNPIVNPLITAIIYAPYRMTLKRLLINFPIGNRPHNSNYRLENTETSFSFLSSGRVQGGGAGRRGRGGARHTRSHRAGGDAGRAVTCGRRANGASATASAAGLEQELSELGATCTDTGSALSSSNKDSVNWAPDLPRDPNSLNSEDVLEDEDMDLKSAQSQPAPCSRREVAPDGDRPQSATFRTSNSADL